jgi:hypothetical protein
MRGGIAWGVEFRLRIILENHEQCRLGIVSGRN